MQIGIAIAALSATRLQKPEIQTNPRGEDMNDTMLKLYIKMQNLKSYLVREEGQDLVEYALVVALIALAATAAMKTLGTDIAAAFTGIDTNLTTSM
jgi:pilus assembly protein Flp/PilA